MDHELRELHQGAHDEQRRLVPDPDPEPEPAEPPRDRDDVTCPRCGVRVTIPPADVDDPLDRTCGGCLTDELVDRHGQTAVAYVEQEVTRR